MSDVRRTIDTDVALERWRYICPNGHTSWEATLNQFWCHKCARNVSKSDGTFEYVTDRKTGDTLRRSEIKLTGFGKPGAPDNR